MLTSTKYLCRQNIGVDKKLASTKSWRLRRRILLLFGSAESTAADFSQTSLKISYVSLMVLFSLHAVAKCVMAAWLILADIGAQRPVLSPLVVPVRHVENVPKFGVPQNIGVHLKFTDFCKLQEPVSQLLGVQSQSCKKQKWSG
jgi:hypothetical protein